MEMSASAAGVMAVFLMVSRMSGKARLDVMGYWELLCSQTNRLL
jgi:hypothetical protein